MAVGYGANVGVGNVMGCWVGVAVAGFPMVIVCISLQSL